EADQHHRPGRGLGRRAKASHSEVETKAAGPVSDERVAEGQVDGGSQVGAEIDDVIPEETLGDRQASKGHVEDFNAVGLNSEFHRLEAQTIGEAAHLIVDQAKLQIAPLAEIEGGGCAISLAP